MAAKIRRGRFCQYLWKGVDIGNNDQVGATQEYFKAEITCFHPVLSVKRR